MKIVIQPQSGLANRLRAVASTALLFPDSEVLCYWGRDESYGVTPPFRHHRIRVINQEEFLSTLPEDPVDRDGLTLGKKSVHLAAGFLGEQAYLRTVLKNVHYLKPDYLVFRAGGEFGVGRKQTRNQERSKLYSELVWDSSVRESVDDLSQGSYLGLHIRQTDLSHMFPEEKEIIKYLKALSLKLGTKEVYLASDALESRTRWIELLSDLDLKPKFQLLSSLGRESLSDFVASCVDFICLSRGLAMVYSAASSFGHEAAIQNLKTRYSRGLLPLNGRIKFLLNSSVIAQSLRFRISKKIYISKN